MPEVNKFEDKFVKKENKNINYLRRHLEQSLLNKIKNDAYIKHNMMFKNVVEKDQILSHQVGAELRENIQLGIRTESKQVTEYR